MAFKLEDIIGSAPLSELVKKVDGGVPDPFPPAFTGPAVTSNVVCDAGRFPVLRDTRKTSRQVHYGSAAVRRQQKDVGMQDVKLLHTFEEQVFDPNLIDRLRNPLTQQIGLDVLKENVADFKRLFDNLRVMAKISMFALGAIYFDSSGNFLYSSSGASLTADPNIPAGNKTDVGGIIGAPWSTSSTNIPLHIVKMKKKYRQDTGKELKYAFYGQNVASNMAINTYVKDFLSHNPVLGAAWAMTGEIPDGLFGLTWIPVYNSFFEDADGTIREIFDGDLVSLCAEPDRSWWRFFQGSYRVPVSMDLKGDALQVMDNFRQEYGMFGYALPIHNPPGMGQYMGDTFLPTPVNEKAIILADTVP